MTVRSKKSINCQSAFPFSIFKLKSRSSASNFSKFYCRVKKNKKKKKKKKKQTNKQKKKKKNTQKRERKKTSVPESFI